MNKEDEILEQITGIAKTNDGIHDQLKKLNSRVGKVEGRVDKLEKEDIYDEGVKDGKVKVRASNKALTIIIISSIGVVATAVACLFTGIAIFKRDNNNLMVEVKKGMGDRFTGSQGVALHERLDKMERQIKLNGNRK